MISIINLNYARRGKSAKKLFVVPGSTNSKI